LCRGPAHRCPRTPRRSVHALTMGSGDARLTVVRANPRELGHHMGLLVRTEGTLPDSFVSPWRTAEPLLSPKLHRDVMKASAIRTPRGRPSGRGSGPLAGSAPLQMRRRRLSTAVARSRQDPGSRNDPHWPAPLWPRRCLATSVAAIGELPQPATHEPDGHMTLKRRSSNSRRITHPTFRSMAADSSSAQ
jgi:hypothetical protein